LGKADRNTGLGAAQPAGPTGANLRSVWTPEDDPYSLLSELTEGELAEVWEHMQEVVARRDGQFGTVQVLPKANLKEPHFAAFSVELAELCIKAGTSQRGYCPHCGRPWVRVVERTGADNRDNEVIEAYEVPGLKQGTSAQRVRQLSGATYQYMTRATNKWRPSCDCEADGYVAAHPEEFPRSRDARKARTQDSSTWVTWHQRATRRAVQLHAEGWPVDAGVVLDPFLGSGTTAVAARGLGRKFIGIDVSEPYCQMARRRVGKVPGWQLRMEGM